MRALPDSVILLLSGRCNLSCTYCYQTARQGQRSMTWRTARAALERVLSFASGEVSIEFSGGEPLLNAPTLLQAVEFVQAHLTAGAEVEYTLTTNGTLLTPPLLAFLFDHEFTIRISFDGVLTAQQQRGGGTFRVLDRLLDELREQHPSDFAKHVKILVTLLGSTIPQLAESVRYLLAKGVQTIEIGPRFTWDPDWCASCREELERQVNEVLRLSLDRWRRTGEVPVTFLAGAPLLDAGAPVGDAMCGASAAKTLSVDPEGRAWACPAFASSLQVLPALAIEASRALDLGELVAPAFPRRLAALPGKASGLRLFTDRFAKRSSYGACADCRFVADCHVCPASICYIPGNRDPDLIPDFLCAYNQVTLAARQRFDELTEGQASAAWYADVRKTLRELGEAIEAAAVRASRTPSGRAREPSRERKKRRANSAAAQAGTSGGRKAARVRQKGG